MVGIVLIIFVKEEIKRYISNLEHESVKLGFLNKFGSQGAVIIRFQINNSNICFINVHLPYCDNKISDKMKIFMVKYIFLILGN